jgi:hypothetical protein
MKTKVYYNYITEISFTTKISFQFIDFVVYTTNDLTILHKSLPKSEERIFLCICILVELEQDEASCNAESYSKYKFQLIIDFLKNLTENSINESNFTISCTSDKTLELVKKNYLIFNGVDFSKDLEVFLSNF